MPQDPLLRLAAAAASRRFRLLGKIIKDAFREAAVAHDGTYFVVMNTEADGNPPPVDPLTEAAYEWNIASSVPGNPTLVTLTTPHNLALGKREYPLSFSGTGISGLTATRFCTAPSETTLLVQVNTTVPTNTGLVKRTATSPMVGIRRALTAEGIAAASGADYISRAGAGFYFPSLLRVGNVWHAFGPGGSSTTVHRKYTGAFPTAANQFLSSVTLPFVVGDISVAYNPADTKFYAVGNPLDENGNPLDTVTGLWVNTDINNDAGWTQVTGNVWSGGTPAWAAGNKADSNIAFYNGGAYLLFTSTYSVPGEWNTGITTLNLTTGIASHLDAVMLQEYGHYEPWQNGHVLSDLHLLAGPDGVPRIYGFVNAPHDTQDENGWGCLDLVEGPGSRAIVERGGDLRIFRPTNRPVGVVWPVKAVNMAWSLEGEAPATWQMPVASDRWSTNYIDHYNRVEYHYEGLPPWIGIITAYTPVGVDGSVECLSAEHLLRLRYVEAWWQMVGTAGAIAQALFQQALRRGPLGIETGQIDMSGPEYYVEYEMVSVYDALMDLVKKTGGSWWIEKGGHLHRDPWLFRWARSRGVNRLADVVISAEVVEDPQMDMAGVELYTAAHTFGVEVDGQRLYGYVPSPAAGKYGVLETKLEYPDIIDPTLLHEAGVRELIRLSSVQKLMGANIDNRRGMWGKFWLGDVVRLILYGQNFLGYDGPGRIKGIQLDVDGAKLGSVTDLNDV